MESKVCAACKKELPTTEFYFRKDIGAYRSSCKKCKRVRTKEEILNRMESGKKVCTHCGVEKSSDEFQKAGGGKWLQPYCKPCDKARKQKYEVNNKDKVTIKRKGYYQENKERINERNKLYVKENEALVKERREKYRIRNAELIRERHKDSYKKHREKRIESVRQKRKDNPDFYRARDRKIRESRTPEQVESKKKYDREYKQRSKDKYKKWREENKDRVREQKRVWGNMKAATDINYRIKRNVRTRIRCALKPNNAYKVDKSEALLGCTIDFFKEYFASLFTEGMNWDRFMAGEIEIDHIKPCKLFDLTNEAEQRACFHYTNTQPLWMVDNMRKGIKTMEEWSQMIA